MTLLFADLCAIFTPYRWMIEHVTTKRGQLRIYLGAAPGVGKTYAMLGEAHRRLERGTDVVAAVVETHGRNKTAKLLEGIEMIPPRYVEYRGARFPELDVEAVLRRHPQVVLVDELAHTNTPGSKNPKRWQDVQEILDAGITVISTVNIQHLEGLNDVVEQITGIEQKEKIPDEIVRAADQVELVDITPEALRRRLAHGNVYAAERVDAALSNYFRTGNLTALREIALLWLADQVDAALEKYRADKKITATWEARERVVVAVTGGPESETLVRRASRIASKSSAELMVVHVIRGDGLAGVSAPQLGRVRELATSLGATMHTVVGDDVPTALLDFAREMNATQLVVGTSRRSRWARLFDEGIGARTVQEPGGIDVHMVTHPAASRASGWSRVSPRERHIASWLAALVVPSVICAITVAWLDRFMGIGGESALFFIGVLIVALLGGVAPAALSALLSGMLLNYFLTEPRYTWTIAEPDAAVTEFVLLAMAVAVAVLVDGAASRTREARRASQEAELLALFAGSVLRGADLATLLQRVRETYSQRAVTMLRVGRRAHSGDRSGGSRGPPMTLVLVIDDEPQILRALRINLTVRGYQVITASTGAGALRAAAEHPPDVVILDLGLPDMSGIDVLGGLRGWLTAPVIVLSARTDSSDKVQALDAGADDYVTKPFGMDEFLARLRAAVRRNTAAAELEQPVIETDSFTVDLAGKKVIKDGAEVHLTPTEWGMLEMLARNRGKLVGRGELLKEVWGPAYATETHYLRVYLAQLRRKLEDDPSHPKHLLTESGMGYRFEA